MKKALLKILGRLRDFDSKRLFIGNEESKFKGEITNIV